MKSVSPNTEAVLLLTAPLLIGKKIDSAKPLTPREYRELAAALIELGREPADLLQDPALLAHIAKGEVADRVSQLLNRGLQLAQALGLWSQRGIRAISRADREYPRRLKARLKDNAPVLLYCCGNLELFSRSGLAVVGSRKVDDHYELVEYADKVGAACAAQNLSIISGGAKGADKISMLGSLKNGGVSVGILSCKLKQEVLSKDYKPYLRDNRLLLCSAVDPSAGWNTGQAMQRNKFIYALAEISLVVASETSGGTWEGATEQLKKFNFCPVLVNVGVLPASGNRKLVEMGAKPIRIDFTQPIQPQLAGASSLSTKKEQTELSLDVAEPKPALAPKPPTEWKTPPPPAASESEAAETPSDPATQIEQAVFPILLGLLSEPMEGAALVEMTGLKKGQLDDWLKKMVEQKLVKKLNKPVRYVVKK